MEFTIIVAIGIIGVILFEKYRYNKKGQKNIDQMNEASRRMEKRFKKYGHDVKLRNWKLEDFDDAGNARASLGVEARNAVLEFSSNYYVGLADATDEKVLDGYDYRLASQIPYLHWANAFVSSYDWSGQDRDDIKGTKLGSEMFLSPTFSLETGFDDKDKAGLEDEWYAKLQFVYPPREGATAQDGISDTMWREEKDMSGQLLTKVKRQNKIMIEFKGSSQITRTD